MNKAYLHNLKKPCANRGLSFEVDENGFPVINEIRFETIRECEEFLESVPRKD